MRESPDAVHYRIPTVSLPFPANSHKLSLQGDDKVPEGEDDLGEVAGAVDLNVLVEQLLQPLHLQFVAH